jgi:hypothetical protein
MKQIEAVFFQQDIDIDDVFRQNPFHFLHAKKSVCSLNQPLTKHFLCQEKAIKKKEDIYDID